MCHSRLFLTPTLKHAWHQPWRTHALRKSKSCIDTYISVLFFHFLFHCLQRTNLSSLLLAIMNTNQRPTCNCSRFRITMLNETFQAGLPKRDTFDLFKRSLDSSCATCQGILPNEESSNRRNPNHPEVSIRFTTFLLFIFIVNTNLTRNYGSFLGAG